MARNITVRTATNKSGEQVLKVRQGDKRREYTFNPLNINAVRDAATTFVNETRDETLSSNWLLRAVEVLEDGNAFQLVELDIAGPIAPAHLTNA